MTTRVQTAVVVVEGEETYAHVRVDMLSTNAALYWRDRVTLCAGTVVDSNAWKRVALNGSRSPAATYGGVAAENTSCSTGWRMLMKAMVTTKRFWWLWQ